MYCANVNVNFTVKNVIQIKCGIKINANVSANVQENTDAKKVIFGILPYVVVKMVDIQTLLLLIQSLCVMKLQKQQKVL